MYKPVLSLLQDSAFLDRVDVKYQISTPCAQARYEILRSSFLELMEASIVSVPQSQGQEQQSRDSMDNPPLSPMASFKPQSQNQSISLLPPYGSMKLHFWSDEQSVAKALWSLAEQCKVCV